jgi:hypothetical protein
MPELTVADVELFTNGRLLASSVETARMLARALAAARKYCGWHVTPVREDDEFTIDGPCSSRLFLPTRQLLDVIDVVEDQIILDVTDLRWSTSKGVVRKKSGANWSGFYNSITVTIDHGFAEAPDFNAAVLSMVDEMASASVGVGAGAGIKRDRVDDVEREWFDAASASVKAVVSVSGLLGQYRILPIA